MTDRSSSHKHHRIGITWKMYAILILFVGIIVGVVWFFQVQLMNYFYQLNKFNELEITAQAISAELRNSSELENVAEEYATNYYTEIWVYHVSENGNANLLVETSASKEEEIPFITKKFAKLYDKAIENEGLYIALVPQDQFRSEFELQILKDNTVETDHLTVIRSKTWHKATHTV